MIGGEIRSVLQALAEPALVVQRGEVLLANDPARRLLGSSIERSAIRPLIRHPEALALPSRLLAADRALKSRQIGAGAVLESLVRDLTEPR